MAQCLCSSMGGLSLLPSTSARSGFATGSALRVPAFPAGQRRPATLPIEARYRGINTDRSKVAQFRRAEADTGSSEVQIAQLTARVAQLTAHLQTHRKDYASTRGLMKVLSRRKSLLQYLKRTDRAKYEYILATLGIRGLKEVIA